MSAETRYLTVVAVIVVFIAVTALLVWRHNRNNSIESARKRREMQFEEAIRRRESGQSGEDPD